MIVNGENIQIQRKWMTLPMTFDVTSVATS